MKALARRLTCACALAATLAALATAGETVLRDSKVTVRTRHAWPQHLNKGFAPLFVELANADARDHEISLKLHSGYGRNERAVTRFALVGAGQTARFEMLAPIAADNWNNFMLQVRSDRGEHVYLNDFNLDYSTDDYQALLAVVAKAPEPGAVESWTADLSTKSIGGAGHTGTSPPAPDDLQVSAAVFDALSESYVAYTSLDLVMLDVRGGLPPAEKLAAICAWVRLGGSLALFGEGAGELARSSSELAPWLEERFRAEHAPANGYACGMGLVVLDETPEPFLESPDQRALVRWIVERQRSNVPDPGGARIGGAAPTIPGLGQIPVRTLAVLLILFAVLIGPVNFIAVRKRAKPLLLLATIPVIALAASLVLLAYGVFFQGLDVKTASRTVALLDERSHRAACIEERQMFAGLAPAKGLRPAAGTCVFPRVLRVEHGSDSRQFLIDEDDGRLHSGEYLPTRVATDQVLHYEHAARGRINVSRSGDGYAIENALGAALQGFALRDAQGALFTSDKRVAPGASVELAVAHDETAAPLLGGSLVGLTRVWSDSRSQSLLEVKAACYVARLDESVFRDDCGIETNELSSDHVVLGVLPLDAEYWR